MSARRFRLELLQLASVPPHRHSSVNRVGPADVPARSNSPLRATRTPLHPAEPSPARFRPRQSPADVPRPLAKPMPRQGFPARPPASQTRAALPGISFSSASRLAKLPRPTTPPIASAKGGRARRPASGTACANRGCAQRPASVAQGGRAEPSGKNGNSADGQEGSPGEVGHEPSFRHSRSHKIRHKINEVGEVIQ